METGTGRLLESWKEISSYLERSVRTCRRWEGTLGLPVHRLDGTPNARVFAYTDELDRWLSEKLHHLEASAVPDTVARGSRPLKIRRLAIAGSGFAVLALIALVARGLFFLPPPPLPAVKPSLAVLPFANETGDTTLDPWQTALADLITVDLGQSRYINVVRITDLLRALARLELDGKVAFSAGDLKTVAATVHVDYLVTGRVAGTGHGRDLIVAVHPLAPGPPGPPQDIRVRFENEAQAPSAADAASRKIKLAAGLTPARVSRDLDLDVSRISTGSPLAFKLFSQGYRLLGVADYQQGIPLLLKAVEEDPQFALAYKYLFRGCENSLREDDAKKYCEQAFRLVARMSERERGELAYLYHDRYTADRTKMTETLERLCRIYPDDRFGSSLLLGIYVGRNDWAKGVPLAERAWSSNKHDINLTTKLAAFRENTGRADEAERLLTGFIDANPGHEYLANALSWRMGLRMRAGKPGLALADLDRHDAIYPNRPGDMILRARLLLYDGKIDDAERIIRPETERGDPGHRISAYLAWSDLNMLRGQPGQAADKLRCGLEIVGNLPEADEGSPRFTREAEVFLRGELAYLFRRTGRLAEADVEIDAALRAASKYRGPGYASPDIWSLKGLILLDLGKTEALNALVNDIREAADKSKRPELSAIYHHLLGCQALKADDTKKAIESLSRSVDLIAVPGLSWYGPNPVPHYDLAEAYLRADGAGFSSRAVALYEKVISPSVDRLSAGDLYALSLYQIARLCDLGFSDRYVLAREKKGFRERAIANYRLFVDLWGSAEPPFASKVEDARRRLAVLEAPEPPK